MTDLKFMEDINNILYSGEVPNIFAIDEKQEIIENMRQLEKELDKSQHTDGSGPGTLICNCIHTPLGVIHKLRGQEDIHT